MAWHHRLLNVVRSRRLHNDIGRELRFHLAEREDELRASGMSAADAASNARRQLGNLDLQLERTRDMDVAAWFDSAWRNLRYSARTLVKTPVFSVTVVATLALAIGANSAVFSAINAVLLEPLPFPQSDQLMQIRQATIKGQIPNVAPLRLTDWGRMNSTFQSITGYYTEDVSELSGELPEKVKQAYVAPRFFETLGIAPSLGRGFNAQEGRFGGPRAVLISDSYWRRHFNTDPGAIGKQLRVLSASVQVVGILPASFLFADRAIELWSPQPMDAPYAQHRSQTWFHAIGRVKPGVTAAQAQADLAVVQTRLGQQYPKTDRDIGIAVRPLKDSVVGGASRTLWLLFGSVSVLLLIACTNIASLLLSRATGRSHEISIRLSLGASRRSLVAQLLAECLLLSIAGAAIGLALANASSTAFRAFSAGIPRVDEIALDWRIVLYSLACAVATTFICGLYPALRATRPLVQSSRSQVSGRSPVHMLLVGVQVSLAVALLVGAGLLFRSFQQLGRVEPGFDAGRVLTFRFSISWGATSNMEALKTRTQRILDHLRTIPGVESASMAMEVPGVPSQYPVELKIVEGRAESEPKVIAESRYVSPEYFNTMRIPLMEGRHCTDSPGNPGVVVNRSFASAYFTGASAIGRHIQQVGSPDNFEVRGVVADVRELGLDRPPVPAAYWCYATAQPGAIFLVRTRSEPALMAETLRKSMREIEPRNSIYEVVPLQARIRDAFAANRLRTILLASFAITAILLACVGLYGTLSYLVNVRRREIGLRLALGALREQIVGEFVRQGVGVSALGCLAGLALAAAFSRLLAGMLYGVSPSDAITFAGVVVIVLAVATIASLLPALRASRLDPMQVLREE